MDFSFQISCICNFLLFIICHVGAYLKSHDNIWSNFKLGKRHETIFEML